MELDISKLGTQEQALLGQLLGKLQQSAATSPKPPKRRRAETIKYLTDPQIQKLFSVIDSVRDRAIFRLAFHRGLRASEIGMIQLADYRVKDDRIQFSRLKGSRGGEYHLCSSEVKALKAWLRERGTEPGALFPARSGKPISRKMLHVLMRKYGQLAGLPAELQHFHTLKHSCATSLLTRGEALEEIQDHLGHRSIASTQCYAQFTSQRRQARDKRLREW